MKNKINGRILLFVGPPGVGKTSFAFSVAKALNKKTYRISLGGESDVSELKGHRRTYVGAKPGKIVQGLKETGSENCCIILDEIDKLTANTNFGDPQSALLEILDPEQNNKFMDNYLDFNVDLSNVLFICTANNLNSISGPLLDRLEIIKISSYTYEEKLNIYNNHLIKNSIKESGLEDYQNTFNIDKNIVEILINQYCREPGVRSLQKLTKKILEKIAFRIVNISHNLINNINSHNEVIEVNKSNYIDFVGNPIFESDKFYEKNLPGIIIGLAYSEMGGSILYIESKKKNQIGNKTGIKYTGTLGDVMKESMEIAYSFSKYFLNKMGNNYLENNLVHIHVPEGATPKDGPSAGIAITSSIISLALNKPTRESFAMTGEISLKGKVMKIGGLKEKILSAKREGIKNIIIPFDNKEDLEELDNNIIQDLNINFASDYNEVYNILFE